MLLNIVSLFCLEAVSLVSRSSFSSPGKLGVTLEFSQTWKSLGFSQIELKGGVCILVLLLFIPCICQWNLIADYTFKDSLLQ